MHEPDRKAGQVRSFYDLLAPHYHLIYADWDASITRQAEQLDPVIREQWGDDVTTVLDAACGIGTQSIGLAQRGYAVTGLTLSEQEIARARREASARNLEIPFHAGDMRDLGRFDAGSFDLVIACDNAIPHLPDDEAILNALRAFHRCVHPGGGCIISVRDYAAMDRSPGHRLHPRHVHSSGNEIRILFDVWAFPDPDHYIVHLYRVTDRGDNEVTVEVARAPYYCITIDRLRDLLQEAGFRRVRALRQHYFQPLLVATRP